ncbi:MAG: hypothetical protein ABW079_02015 [Sedimenticola sp.]
MKKLNELLVTGGLLRPGGFDLGPGKYYGCASLIKLNTDTGEVNSLIKIEQGNKNYPPEYPNLQFTAGCIDGDVLWLPTDTEIRKYSLNNYELLSIYSHPCFQNIHSVAAREDKLYVTSTGLDQVVVLAKDSGDIVTQINAESKPLWHRFSETIDYRQWHSTRPHDCHPNYIFWLDHEPWVTRCTQEDAVCLSDNGKRIDISGPNKKISVHDGIVIENRVYFTSVDGCIVVADTATCQVIETIDLTSLPNYGGVRGWCRGLCYVNGIFYVGFSRLRRTKSIEKLDWLQRVKSKVKRNNTSSVLGIDLKSKRIVSDYTIPENALDAIYTILPLE